MTQQSDLRETGWGRLALVVMAAGILSLAAAAVLFALIMTDTVGNRAYSGPGTTVGLNTEIDLSALQPAPTPVEPPSEAPIARIAIPRFEVNAPVVIRGVGPDGVMESPDGPVDVAWYEFTARPGFGSNAVFSGHVDYINHGPAVFWNLKDMVEGDIIEVHLEDGTTYRYEMISRKVYSAAASSQEINEIIGNTEAEIVTLITCGGPFDSASGQYLERTVVRAQRVPDDVASADTSAQH